MKPLLMLLIWTTLFHTLQSQSDIEQIKSRIYQETAKSEVNDTRVEELLTTITSNGIWPEINYEDVSRTGFEHRFHLSNLVTLAHAYRTNNSRFHQSQRVKQTIELALNHWVEKDYQCDNWWYNQIGNPNALVTLMLLIGDQLDNELVTNVQPIIARANIDAPGARPGGDRIKIAGIQAKQALFLDDAPQFEAVVKVIEQEIKFSDWVGIDYGYGFKEIPTGFSNRGMGGRGIQHDFSFHHRVDGVNNTLSYGLSYANAFVEWAVYTSGTKYAFSEEKLNLLIDYYLDGVCKTAVFGKYPDAGAKNRSIARPGTLKPYQATIPEKLIQTSDYRKDDLQEIIDIRKNNTKPTLAHATYYWHSEHFSFQRPDWFTSVRLYSTRTHNMEVPYNSEGLLNHHRGDGANHISRTGEEYLDIWPVYDYQKIPGATILQKPSLPSHRDIQKLGLTSFVGAATDGKYGTVAFDFRSPHDPLIARKSWFFFDEEYVCLGAGISSKNRNLPVFTTLNQAHLKGSVIYSDGENLATLQKGDSIHQKIDWVLHDQIGYVFPTPTQITLKNDHVTGSWWRISQQTKSAKDALDLEVFKLWIDHGIRPSSASYAYIVVPSTSKEALLRAASKSNISILSNSPALQAVFHKDLGRYQLVFYQGGSIQLSEDLELESATPGLFLLSTKAGKFELTVSDPSRTLTKMLVSVTRKVEKEGTHFRSVWDAEKRMSHILIDLPGGQFAGKSLTISFQ